MLRRDRILRVRVCEDDLSDWRTAAVGKRMLLSEWVRSTLRTFAQLERASFTREIRNASASSTSRADP
jgi:hypothetical protein